MSSLGGRAGDLPAQSEEEVFGEFAAHVTGEEDLLGREVDVVTERALHSRIRERVLWEVPPSPMGVPLSDEVYQRRSLPRTHPRTDAGSRAYERMQIPHVLTSGCRSLTCLQ